VWDERARNGIEGTGWFGGEGLLDYQVICCVRWTGWTKFFWLSDTTFTLNLSEPSVLKI
jgi:hypothetical protein